MMRFLISSRLFHREELCERGCGAGALGLCAQPHRKFASSPKFRLGIDKGQSTRFMKLKPTPVLNNEIPKSVSITRALSGSVSFNT
jgi:hypothetical protein